jgi:hypothetical protein
MYRESTHLKSKRKLYEAWCGDASIGRHGGLVAHNVECDMVSHWETMGFMSTSKILPKGFGVVFPDSKGFGVAFPHSLELLNS